MFEIMDKFSGGKSEGLSVGCDPKFPKRKVGSTSALHPNIL